MQRQVGIGLAGGSRLRYAQGVSRRLFQFAAGVVLIFAILTPLANCFDWWDKNPAPANDTELHLTAWFAGVGFVLALRKLLRHLPAPGVRAMRRVCASFAFESADPARPEPNASPPLIPLRI